MVQTLPIRNDQSRRLLSACTDHHHLAHKLTLLQQTLDQLRRNILSLGKFEQIFLSVGDVKMTVLLHVADVTGIKPAILQHRRRFFRLPVVTTHHIWTTDKDLAVVSNSYFDSIERYSNRSHMIVVGPVRRYNARLGRAITLEDRYSCSQVRIRQRRRKRCATGNEVAQTAANALTPFRKH